jgi:hypothetical protein
MLNLFQHPTCLVYNCATCPVGCRNKFGMTGGYFCDKLNPATNTRRLLHYLKSYISHTGFPVFGNALYNGYIFPWLV